MYSLNQDHTAYLKPSITSKRMLSTDHSKLIRFLQEELAIPPQSINQALTKCQENAGPLPIVLWQQGVLSLKQLERIFDWMEMA